MSADMMLVCNKRKENFENNSRVCVKVDETSMGMPWSEFGKILAGHFGGLLGGPIIDDKFIEKVKKWYDVLGHEQADSKESIIAWLEDHKGEGLEYECW